ncbi:MAG TPA: hypothetical protein PKK20_04400, partial [Verrucomicrobiota bacterium]|nr:hypothetical protein [Verrucomicrobiota bacterium]HPV10808.1 hypothetical protein [Verrucomicrobiota bacterium]
CLYSPERVSADSRPRLRDASALFAATLAHGIREGADAQATFTFAQEHAQRHVQSASVREALLAPATRAVLAGGRPGAG